MQTFQSYNIKLFAYMMLVLSVHVIAAESQTQDLVHARQVLYHWAVSSFL